MSISCNWKTVGPLKGSVYLSLSTVIHLWDLIIHAHVLYCKKIEDAMGGSCWQLPLFLHWIMRNEYSWDHVLKQVRPHFFPTPFFFFFYLCILLHSVGANGISCGINGRCISATSAIICFVFGLQAICASRWFCALLTHLFEL